MVTETLYALACRPELPWITDEIHLFTTATGAENARLNLLLADGWFHRLCADYQLPAIRFPLENIHILKDAAGHPLDDIRTPEQNTLAADFITETLRRLTLTPESSYVPGRWRNAGWSSAWRACCDTRPSRSKFVAMPRLREQVRGWLEAEK